MSDISSDIIVALISAGGGVVVGGISVLASARLTNYRIKKLEEKVDKHNNFAERLPVVENSINFIEKEIEGLKRGESE